MPLGDSRSNNNSKKLFESTYYSRLGFRDYSHNSGRRLGVSFRSGMLILTISAEKNGGFEFEELISVHITITKARIFANQLTEFYNQYKEGNITDPNIAYGINTGMGDIQTVAAIHVNENGIPALFIGKIDNAGNYTQKEDYLFNAEQFHYGINISNLEKLEYDKNTYKDLEVEQLITLLTTFADNMMGSTAYSTIDLGRYDYKAMLNKMNPIYDKLGIERGYGGNSSTANRSYSGGFFENNGGKAARSNRTDLDSIKSGFSFEEDEE